MPGSVRLPPKKKNEVVSLPSGPLLSWPLLSSRDSRSRPSPGSLAALESRGVSFIDRVGALRLPAAMATDDEWMNDEPNDPDYEQLLESVERDDVEAGGSSTRSST